MLPASAPPPPIPSGQELLEKNRRFYESLWSDARLIEPERFNTWSLVQALVSASRRRLEVAPGLRPRLPIIGTHFLDISEAALGKLRRSGAEVALGEVTALPFADATFELVCALDIIEHVDDDERALGELARVATAGAALLISTPLHAALWTSFDDFVGHKRRYEPGELIAKLARHDLVIERSAVFGMKPRSTRLVDIGMWWLLNHRERAMWWYNHAFMRIGLWFQKELRFTPGMVPTDGVDEVLLLCRKSPAGRAAPIARDSL
jgi:SAM-dependent methyltransferase